MLSIPALGDFIFKLPSVFTRKVILNASPGLKVSVPVESYLERILTPPYISNIAEIHHRKLGNGEKYLILSSDGLSDLYHGRKEEDIRREWAEVVGYAGLGLDLGGKDGGQKATKKNKALELLRTAIGGGNEERVSMHLTLERDGRWMDDTTIVVVKLTNA
jgi:pyruvate dehydrogenase phosphatase